MARIEFLQSKTGKNESDPFDGPVEIGYFVREALLFVSALSPTPSIRLVEIDACLMTAEDVINRFISGNEGERLLSMAYGAH